MLSLFWKRWDSGLCLFVKECFLAWYCPGHQHRKTGRNRNTEPGNQCWMLFLPLWAEGLKSFRRGHLLSHFQTSCSRYLIECVFLMSYSRWAPIQAAGIRWVPGKHSCKHAVVPESWQTEQSNWDAEVVIMPEEGSKHKQCASSPAPILHSWYKYETPAGVDCFFHINPGSSKDPYFLGYSRILSWGNSDLMQKKERHFDLINFCKAVQLLIDWSILEASQTSFQFCKFVPILL